MKRKGLLETASLAVVTFLMIGTVATVGIQNTKDVGHLIRSESLGIVQERIESAIYAVDAFDRSKIEMEFKGGSNYIVYAEDGENYLEYRFSGDSTTVKLDNSLGLNYRVDGRPGDDPVDKICISKNPDIVVSLGGC